MVGSAGMCRMSPSRDASDPARRPIPVTHYSTDALKPDDAHRDWVARGFPSVAAMFDSIPLEPFSTDVDQVQLDELTVQFAQGTARDFGRSAARLREDGITVLGVNVQIDGHATGRASGRDFAVDPGGLLLLDMMQASHVSIPRGRSIQIGIPRALADDQLGAVRRLHGTVVSPDRAAMLLGHLFQLRESLPALTEAQKPRLARTIMDMLAIALERVDVRVAVVPQATRDLTAVAVRREIEAQLELPSLGVASLCERLGLSRSVLYRLFEGEGGVEAYIRRRRLEQVHAALIDPGNAERVGDLAHRWCFSDASHLTRLFREAYGVTPSSIRRIGGSRD